MTNIAACAHSRVTRGTIDAGLVDGPCGRPVRTVRDEWACADCGAVFVPGWVAAEQLATAAALAEQNRVLREALEALVTLSPSGPACADREATDDYDREPHDSAACGVCAAERKAETEAADDRKAGG